MVISFGCRAERIDKRSLERRIAVVVSLDFRDSGSDDNEAPSFDSCARFRVSYQDYGNHKGMETP